MHIANIHASVIYSLIVILLLNSAQVTAATKNSITSTIQLATQYSDDIDISQFWVSEKLDGVRGYWDGEHLYTRTGNLINVPNSFTLGWPKIVAEGELWCGRGCFEQISALVRSKQTKAQAWRNVKFMMFDLPHHKGSFSERIIAMKRFVKATNNQHFKMVAQYRVSSNALLNSWLAETIAAQGEGLMLHHQDAYYQAGRSKHILKLKPFDDAEAQVIAHLPGKGKYHQQLGALLVKTVEGIEFKIGSGFSDQQRSEPPPIGSIITYKYSGKSEKGVPRFASFLRVRHLSNVNH